MINNIIQPYNIAFSVLFSNMSLLDKYQKSIPKTWDELKNTTKYILEQENNPELIGYNGFLDGKNIIIIYYLRFIFIYQFI